MSSNSDSAVSTLSELSSLVDNLLLLLSDKEKNVIVKRFNLDGNRRYTLEEIGGEFSVTRERVRQIEKSALNKMRRNVFNTSLKHLHEFVSDVVREHGGIMKEGVLYDRIKALSPNEISVNPNNTHLSLVLHENLDCIGNTITFFPYIKEKNLPINNLKTAADHLVNHLNRVGDAKKISALQTDLKDIFENLKFDLTRTKSLISIDKRLKLLDDDFVALMEWRHINPRTLRDKILYVLKGLKKPMHFTEIAKQIEEKNFDKRQINIQAVHNELIRHDQFVLIGRGIYALAEWGYERGTVAEVIEAILKEKKELEQDEIVDLVLKKRQVKKITIILALKNGKKFERIGRKRYKLQTV